VQFTSLLTLLMFETLLNWKYTFVKDDSNSNPKLGYNNRCVHLLYFHIYSFWPNIRLLCETLLLFLRPSVCVGIQYSTLDKHFISAKSLPNSVNNIKFDLNWTTCSSTLHEDLSILTCILIIIVYIKKVISRYISLLVRNFIAIFSGLWP
jgi:hypothetical protein